MPWPPFRGTRIVVRNGTDKVPVLAPARIAYNKQRLPRHGRIQSTPARSGVTGETAATRTRLVSSQTGVAMVPEPITRIDVPTVAGARPRAWRLESAGLSDVGKVRPNNEDHFLVCRLCKSLQVLQTNLAESPSPPPGEQEGYLLLVADGMGGVAAGEHASATVARGVQRHLLETAKWFFRLDDPDEDVRVRLLKETLEGLDRQLIEEARQDPSLYGMGTTLTAAGIVDGAAF